MPTKLNKAGNQQPYVPQGNGDASGEYADNATGSNRHFTNFKKPDEPKTDDTSINTNQEETKPEVAKSKYKYSIKKGKFQYNNVWKKWYYYSPEQYEKYLKQKENAERYGYMGYNDDLWEEREFKLIDSQETEKIVEESKKLFKEEVDKLDIKQLNKMSKENIYKDIINKVIGDDFNEEEKEIFIKENSLIFKEDAKELSALVDERKIQVSKEYIEKNFSKIKGEHSIEDDLKNTNPKYNESGLYHINCQRCSYAYELRRRGYDVQAFPNDDDYGSKKGTFWTRQMKHTEMYSFNNSIGATRLHQKISEKVLAAGDGSRWAIEVQWTRRRTGHLFIVENVGGEVKYFDAQMGRMDCITYLNNVATSKQTTIKRMDNADFDIGVIMTGFSSPTGEQYGEPI